MDEKREQVPALQTSGRVRWQDPGNLAELNFGGVLTGWMSQGRAGQELPASESVFIHPKTTLGGQTE